MHSQKSVQISRIIIQGIHSQNQNSTQKSNEEQKLVQKIDLINGN